MPLGSCTRWFNELESGRKTVEGRLWNPSFHVGQALVLTCGERTITRKVTFIRRYVDARHMLQVEGLDQVLPGITNLDEGCRIFRGFFTQDIQELKGIVAIGIDQSDCIRTITTQPKRKSAAVSTKRKAQGVSVMPKITTSSFFVPKKPKVAQTCSKAQ